MKKIAIVLCLAAFIGFAFSPVAFSNHNENMIEYSDTTKKTVKKSTSKSDCSSSCSKSCTKSKTSPTKNDPKKK